MFRVKQKKRIFLTGAMFFVLIFSFFLNGNLKKNVVFSATKCTDIKSAEGTCVYNGVRMDMAQAAKLQAEEEAKAAPAASGTTPPPASTPANTGSDDSCVWNPVKCVLYGLLTFCAWLASFAAAIFMYVLDVSHLQAIMGNAVIYEVWRIVRDMFNLFFIFSLLIVAFSTIFQVDKFGGLKSIWNIVLAALFINFSFPIARMVIDLGNVMMYSFITDVFNMTGASLNGGILNTSGLKAIFLPENRFNSDLDVKFYLIAIMGMFMFGVSFLTLALMMFYRLFMLPILVMFSPIGFAGAAIPGMGGYSKQWWDKLVKNVFFGPIAVFMMMLAVKFLQVLMDTNIAGNKAANTGQLAADNFSATFLSSIVYMTIPIIFFWIAITTAEKLSSEASGMSNAFGSKFLKWGGALPWRGTKEFGSFAGRKWEKAMVTNKYAGATKYLAPTVVKDAFQAFRKRRHDLDTEHIGMATAEATDEMNANLYQRAIPIIGRKFWKEPLDKTDNAYKAFSAKVSEKEKEFSSQSTDQNFIIPKLANAIKNHETEKAAALINILTKSNDPNDMMLAMGLLQAETGMNFGRDKDGKSIPMPSVFTTENAKTAIVEMLKASGLKDEKVIAKNLMNISNIATNAGNVGMAGLANYSKDAAGNYAFRISTEEEIAGTAAGKFQNMETQARQRMLHPMSVFAVDAGAQSSGQNIGDLNGEVGRALLGTITGGDIAEAKRSRDDLKREVALRMALRSENPDMFKKMFPAMEDELNKSTVVRNYFNTITDLYFGTDKESIAKAEKTAGYNEASFRSQSRQESQIYQKFLDGAKKSQGIFGPERPTP